MSAVEEPLSFSSRRLGRDLALHGVRELYASGAHIEPSAEDVFARVRAQALPGMVAFERSLDGISLVRTAAQVRRTGFDHFVLQHIVSGELRVDVGDDQRILRAGDSVWLDTTKPNTMTAIGCHLYTLSVPRERLAAFGISASQLHSVVVPTRDLHYQSAFSRLIRGAGESDLEVLISRSITPESRRPSGLGLNASARRTRREAALNFIEAHLHRSNLSPEMVIAGARTSRATLYRAFEELGGVSEWILSRRLRRLRSALMVDRRPLADMIGDFGFVSLSHATTAFRSRYGVSPGALRDASGGEPSNLQVSPDQTRRLLDDIPAAFQRAPSTQIAVAA